MREDTSKVGLSECVDDIYVNTLFINSFQIIINFIHIIHHFPNYIVHYIFLSILIFTLKSFINNFHIGKIIYLSICIIYM